MIPAVTPDGSAPRLRPGRDEIGRESRRIEAKPTLISRGAGAALAVAVALAAGACAGGSPTGLSAAGGEPVAPEQAAAADRAVVEVVSGADPVDFLDPDAAPSTALGRLRAQHLPVWTSDFDWAFPPEACDTAWELDGIAEPTAGADLAVMGDFATAAALTVMRYEHQFSRALADPSPLAQLCVATATVEPARTNDLTVLASYLAAGARRSEPAAYPDEMWILAVSPTAALAVACVTPGYPAVVGVEGETIEPAQSPARLQAYLMSVSRGLEDQVADISYRVSNASHRPAEDCTGLGCLGPRMGRPCADLDGRGPDLGAAGRHPHRRADLQVAPTRRPRRVPRGTGPSDRPPCPPLAAPPAARQAATGRITGARRSAGPHRVTRPAPTAGRPRRGAARMGPGADRHRDRGLEHRYLPADSADTRSWGGFQRPFPVRAADATVPLGSVGQSPVPSALRRVSGVLRDHRRKFRPELWGVPGRDWRGRNGRWHNLSNHTECDLSRRSARRSVQLPDS